MTWSHELIMGAVPPDHCEALLESAGAADRIIMPHRTHGAFRIAMGLLADHASRKLGPHPISGLGSDYFATSAGFATHKDNDYVQALPGTFMSVWLPLADVTEENGPLVIEGKPIFCRKGDVLLIDGDTPHRSCAGRGPRPVALFTYIKSGSPFRPGNQQKREEVPL